MDIQTIKEASALWGISIRRISVLCNKGRISGAQKIFDNLAYVMAELNIIHPFREGNGRAIREFIRLMAKKLNYDLNW